MYKLQIGSIWFFSLFSESEDTIISTRENLFDAHFKDPINNHAPPPPISLSPSWLQLSLPQSEAMRGREESQAAPSCHFWDAGMRLWLKNHTVRQSLLTAAEHFTVFSNELGPQRSVWECVFTFCNCTPFLKYSIIGPKPLVVSFSIIPSPFPSFFFFLPVPGVELSAQAGVRRTKHYNPGFLAHCCSWLVAVSPPMKRPHPPHRPRAGG